MKTYSLDLRERVMLAIKAAQVSQAKIAITFRVSLSTVEKWWHRQQTTGHCTAQPHAGGLRRTLAKCERTLRKALLKQPDATLAELCKRVFITNGVIAAGSMMCRELQRLRLPRKKKSLHDTERNTPRVQGLRQTYVAQMHDILASRYVFIDETGLHLGLTRLYGRAAPGQRVVEATPDYSGVHYTLVAALGWKGIQAPLIFKGAMNRLIFETYVIECLAPTLRRGQIVVMDNLSSHTNPMIRTAIEARGASLVYLSPYSSDFNPIELGWAKFKTAWRAAKARGYTALVTAVGKGLLAISSTDAQGWFAHCGYAVNA